MYREHFEIHLLIFLFELHAFTASEYFIFFSRCFPFLSGSPTWSLHKNIVCIIQVFLVSLSSVCVHSANPTFQQMLIMIIVLHLRSLFKVLQTHLELILVRWSYLLPVGVDPFAKFLAGQHTKLIFWIKSPGAIMSLHRLSPAPTGLNRTPEPSRFYFYISYS